ncbi:MAG: hypothetical protein GXP33_06525 [Spirochaetes bacterium]|nr:hypothetical protein [Spirochaetota bacterium]
MNIPDNYRKMIIEELESIEKLCKEASAFEDKLYFFSGSFGILNRIMNFYTDPTLIFMHQVLQTTHQAFFQRINTKTIPGVIYNTIPESFIDSLFLYLSELRAAFEENDQNKIWQVLEKFSVLTYATTGNGFFLYLRGKLKI